MNKTRVVIDGISEWTGKVVSFLIIPIMLVIVLQIIMRGVFTSPLMWPHELSCILFGALFMIGGAYTLRYGGHVNVDIIISHLSPRKHALLDIITSSMIFLFCGVIAWKSGEMTLQAFRFGFRYASAWAPPIWPIKGAITLAAALVFLQALAKLARDFHIAISEKTL